MVGRSFHTPYAAPRMARKNAKEETQYTFRQCERIHTMPSRMNQRAGSVMPACEYPYASEAVPIITLNTKATRVNSTSSYCELRSTGEITSPLPPHRPQPRGRARQLPFHNPIERFCHIPIQHLNPCALYLLQQQGALHVDHASRQFYIFVLRQIR